MTDIYVAQIYTNSLIKEMQVMESVRRPCTIDFSPFFGNYEHQIHIDIPINRRVAKDVNRCIDLWMNSLQEKVLYPRLGSKTVSKMASDELYGMFPDYVSYDEKGITPIDLERVYHSTGYQVLGPCEMRQKWYSSILKPRTYYTQGGQAYHTSKYLAIPFVKLCDTLPATNRRTRIQPNRIVIRDPTDDIAYYDLSSFTTNLHVHREFMVHLSVYCRGHNVRILDSVEGVVHRDLGQMIYEYTMHNLCHPEYVIPTKYDKDRMVRYHNVAGFLGVYGNIATATFIHGIVMAMTHNNYDENNVAGDDGLDVTKDVTDTLNIVSTLGTVADEKTFRESEGCCIHLKRPIQRIGNVLVHGTLITWPSLEPGMENIDNRYPYLQRSSKLEKRNMIASSITAFLRKLETQKMSQDEYDLIDHFLLKMYSEYGLPKGGNVPQLGNSKLGFVSTYERRFIGINPLINTIQRNYVDIARLPLRDHIPWDHGMFIEGEFMCNQTPLLKHLEVLGYLEQEKISIYVCGREGMEQLMKEYTKPEPRVYRYFVIKKLPSWVIDYSS
jgi:hypothetical protein